jgi:hypothetical protein
MRTPAIKILQSELDVPREIFELRFMAITAYIIRANCMLIKCKRRVNSNRDRAVINP